jgi:hypothetical protein
MGNGQGTDFVRLLLLCDVKTENSSIAKRYLPGRSFRCRHGHIEGFTMS